MKKKKRSITQPTTLSKCWLRQEVKHPNCKEFRKKHLVDQRSERIKFSAKMLTLAKQLANRITNHPTIPKWSSHVHHHLSIIHHHPSSIIINPRSTGIRQQQITRKRKRPFLKKQQTNHPTNLQRNRPKSATLRSSLPRPAAARHSHVVRRRSDRWLPGRRWGVVPKRVWSVHYILHNIWSYMIIYYIYMIIYDNIYDHIWLLYDAYFSHNDANSDNE